MSIASTSKSRVAYIAETSFGVTPTTPTFLEMRRTSGNLATEKGTAVSDEVRLDRNVREEMQLSQDPGGQYEIEFSYGSYDALLEAVCGGTWTTNVLVNGNTARSFTFEETVDVGGGSFAYHRFLGNYIDGFSLNIAARQKVTGTISIAGRQESATASSIISGATYTAPNTEPVMTANSVGSLSLAGLSPTPALESITIQMTNNFRRRGRVGSMHTEEFGSGAFDVTGVIRAYFDDPAIYDAVLSHGGGAAAFTIGALANKKYSLLVPKLRFLSGRRVMGGKNDDVMVEIPYRGEWDSSTGGSIRFTRAVA